VCKTQRAERTDGRNTINSKLLIFWSIERKKYLKVFARRLILAVKLFCLMGGTWLMEFVSWLAEQDHVVWLIFDLVNILRGAMYFYLSGTKRIKKPSTSFR